MKIFHAATQQKISHGEMRISLYEKWVRVSTIPCGRGRCVAQSPSHNPLGRNKTKDALEIAAEEIAGIDLVCNIFQVGAHAVGHNDIGAPLELREVVQHRRPEEIRLF